MEQKKRAWVYCRIDAPEDAHGALKGQRQQLMDYADQMNFIVAGSSEDLASGLSFDRPGLNRFVEGRRGWKDRCAAGPRYVPYRQEYLPNNGVFGAICAERRNGLFPVRG